MSRRHMKEWIIDYTMLAILAVVTLSCLYCTSPEHAHWQRQQQREVQP